jgi:Ni/Co efflux regulator RcnB
MKRLLLSTAAALAMLSAPLAMAQPAPNHDAAHGPASGHAEKSNMAMPHQATPSGHNAPQRMDAMSSGHGEKSNMAMPHQATPSGHNAPQRMDAMTPGHGEKSNMATPRQATPMQHTAYSGHAWHNGDRYNGSRHSVSNWQYYHLRQPPAGYEWVQDGDQFVLIAVTSGIIAEVIANAMNQ